MNPIILKRMVASEFVVGTEVCLSSNDVRFGHKQTDFDPRPRRFRFSFNNGHPSCRSDVKKCQYETNGVAAK
jgi:hypothetical protein